MSIYTSIEYLYETVFKVKCDCGESVMAFGIQPTKDVPDPSMECITCKKLYMVISKITYDIIQTITNINGKENINSVVAEKEDTY